MPNYPWPFPANIVPKQIEFIGNSTVAAYKSPYTNRLDTYRYTMYPGQYWQLEMEFPSYVQTNAANMRAFLCGLFGQMGTFNFPIPTPFLMSGSVTGITYNEGNDINVTSGTPQVGLYGYASYTDNNIAANRLVQFTSPTTIFPAFPAGTALTITPSGSSTYRMTTGDVQWKVDAMLEHAFKLSAVEDI